MTLIYWFRQDARLADNRALAHATARARPLLPIVIRHAPATTAWGFERKGPHRVLFENQAQNGLAHALENLSSALYCPAEPGVDGLIALCHELGVDEIICEAINAPEELAQIHQIEQSRIKVTTIEQSAMLDSADLPFSIEDTPIVFTEYRKQIEKSGVTPRTPTGSPAQLPPLPDDTGSAQKWLPNDSHAQRCEHSAFPYWQPAWHGHEHAAQAHIKRYFSSDLPRTYKTTRNGLLGTDYSTKFSPWLAVGAMSGRQVFATLLDHEAKHGANDSTYWIWFELLWRDHFRLMMRRFGKRLFREIGLRQGSGPPTTDPNALDHWRQGRTGHGLIDAGMRELKTTGYLSNRMRQIVASYLIHDLQGDWLAGAAWFEHCLIDFDVHSNQGNWAYIAGVGTDPRGGRRFNTDKQARDYDADGAYRAVWGQMI